MDLQDLPKITIPQSYVYRFVQPQYSQCEDAISGNGALKAAGRYGLAGMTRIIYLSFDEETAFKEVQALAKFLNFPIHRIPPLVWIALRIRDLEVIDLTDKNVLESLGITEKELTNSWRKVKNPLTHQIGKAAHAAGLMGLIVPSSANKNGRNLVVFPDHLTSADQIACATPVKWK